MCYNIYHKATPFKQRHRSAEGSRPYERSETRLRDARSNFDLIDDDVHADPGLVWFLFEAQSSSQGGGNPMQIGGGAPKKCCPRGLVGASLARTPFNVPSLTYICLVLLARKPSNLVVEVGGASRPASAETNNKHNNTN